MLIALQLFLRRYVELVRAGARAAVSPAGRRWLYRVSLAGLAAAVALGWLPKETAVVAIPLITALLNVNDDEQ